MIECGPAVTVTLFVSLVSLLLHVLGLHSVCDLAFQNESDGYYY